jgi:hypothetical protein
MGLDMYLERHYYYGGKYRGEDWNKEGHTLDIDGKFVSENNIQKEKINSIIVDGAYWRKANQIHRWFVENVQEGNDDCGQYFVTREKLEELFETCKRVLKALENDDINTAKELLPTLEGFFFGDYEIDEWYKENIEDTIEMLEPLLAKDSADLYYSSSW